MCIHQLDVVERNNQVNLMSSIDLSAESVYAWLGLETLTTHLGLRILEYLDTPAEEVEPEIPDPSIHSITCGSDEALLAAVDLLTREYWTRLWIVQEAVYARKLCLLCG